MNKLISITIIFLIFQLTFIQAQVAISETTATPDPSSILDIQSSNKGLLIPRGDTISIVSPALGLLLYQLSDKNLYQFNGVKWSKLAGDIFDQDGDTGIVLDATPDNDEVHIEVNGEKKISFRENSNGILIIEPDLQSQGENLFIGSAAGEGTTFGERNIGIGNASLNQLDEGEDNVAIGKSALEKVKSGTENVGIGSQALENSIFGFKNTAIGHQAGKVNQGIGNVFLGNRAGALEDGSNRLYIQNTNADSANALIYGEFDKDILKLNAKVSMRDGWFDTDGDTGIDLDLIMDDDRINFIIENDPVAFISKNDSNSATLSFIDGYQSVFVGENSGRDNGTGAGTSANKGKFNTGLGHGTLRYNKTGDSNTAVGHNSLLISNDGQKNTAVGYQAGATTLGDANVFLGYSAGILEEGSNRLYIENSSAGSSDALIYGEFDNDLIKLNGKVSIKDGWFDEDGDTGIELDSNPDDDRINFIIDNHPRMYISNNDFNSTTLHINDSYGCVFIGRNSGRKNGFGAVPSGGIDNTGIGDYSLELNEEGSENTAIGRRTLGRVISGTQNTGVGFEAGYFNNFGVGNVFLGYQAGRVEIGSNKLYIENSDANSNDALIYGEFDNDLLTFNADVINDGKLDVDGYTSIIADSDGDSAQLNLIEDNAGYARLNFTNSSAKDITLAAFSHTNTDLSRLNVFIEDEGDILVVKGDNRVGVGINPNSDLHVRHIDDNTRGFKLENTASTTDHWRFFVNASSGDLALYSDGNSTSVGKFDDNTGVYAAVSDRRAKENFKPLHFDWQQFMMLKTKNYTMKSDKDGKQQLGLIAQDVEKIYPEIVSYDAVEDKYMMNYAGTGVIAIKAVQELYKENQELHKANHTFKSQNDDLVKRMIELESQMQSLLSQVVIEN